jgi:hypothetical protein
MEKVTESMVDSRETKRLSLHKWHKRSSIKVND